MEVRFEIAKSIGNGSSGLMRPADPTAPYQPAIPPMQQVGMDQAFSTQTRAVLDQAKSPAEWNMLFLSSPEFMRR